MKKRAFHLDWKKIRYFIWEENSILSWIFNLAMAFVIIKFLVYPGLGFFLSTTNPVVAVVSCSMEHGATDCGKNEDLRICGRTYEDKKNDFDSYWDRCGEWYDKNQIPKNQFSEFPFSKGFNKGDLMILRGTEPSNLRAGDVIVFRTGVNEPIIHRIVSKRYEDNSTFFQTKGDNNANQLSYEKKIPEENVIGRAILKIPFLGYVKIASTEIFNLFRSK